MMAAIFSCRVKGGGDAGQRDPDVEPIGTEVLRDRLDRRDDEVEDRLVEDPADDGTQDNREKRLEDP